MAFPDTIKVGDYTFEVYRGRGRKNTRYNGFCLSTCGIYLSKDACKDYEQTDWVRIDIDTEQKLIKLSPSIPGSHHLGRSRNQVYVATSKLQRIMPIGRYVYKMDHESGKIYQLQKKTL